MGEFLLTLKADCYATEKGRVRRPLRFFSYAALFFPNSLPDAVSIICRRAQQCFAREQLYREKSSGYNRAITRFLKFFCERLLMTLERQML